MTRTRVLPNIIRNTKLRQAKSSPETAFRSTDFRVPENLIFPALTTTESVIRQRGESQNGCSKKTKHVIFSEKRTLLPPDTHTYVRVYQGVKNVCFSKNNTCFAFLKYPLYDSSFCLITDENNY